MAYTREHTTNEPTRAEIDASAGPLLVEFGAPWCPHCQVVQPTLIELFKQYPDVRHIKIYDGRGKPLGRSFRVKLWPNLVFLRDGKVQLQLARPSDDEIARGFELIAGAAQSTT